MRNFIFVSTLFFFSIFFSKEAFAGQGCLFCYCDASGRQWGCMHSCYPNPNWLLCGESDCQGPGGDRCQGAAPSLTPTPIPERHLSCAAGSCTMVSGGGANECSTTPDAGCASHAVTWGLCNRTCGGGTQIGTCDNGSCGTATITRPCNTQGCPAHLTCVGSACLLIEDSDGTSRPDTCSTAPDLTCSSHQVTWGSCSTTCGPGTQVGTCDNGSCGQSTVTRSCNLGPCLKGCSAGGKCVAGGSGRGCLSDSDCFSHTVCSNGACRVVSGAGINQCRTDADCSHMGCNAAGSCVSIRTPGENTCSTNAECTTSMTCDSSGRCVLGGGGVSCTTNADCRSEVPTPTVMTTPPPVCEPSYSCVGPLNCYERDQSCGRGQRYNPGRCNPSSWFRTEGGDAHSNKSIRVNLSPGNKFATYLVTSTYMSYFSSLSEAGGLASEKGWYTRGGYNKKIEFPSASLGFFDYYSKEKPAEVVISGDLTQANLNSLVSKVAASDQNLMTRGEITLGAGTVVIYVKKNLTVSGNIKVSGSGALVFVVGGDLNVEAGVGEADGVFLVDGVVNTTSTVGGNKPLLVKGALLGGRSGKIFGRSRSLACNFGSSAERFVFEPKYLSLLAPKMGKSFIFWREVEP